METGKPLLEVLMRKGSKRLDDSWRELQDQGEVRLCFYIYVFTGRRDLRIFKWDRERD